MKSILVSNAAQYTQNIAMQTNLVTKMNSLYQIRSKMLHGMKVIILVEKNRKRGDLTTFILEVETITPWILHDKLLLF